MNLFFLSKWLILNSASLSNSLSVFYFVSYALLLSFDKVCPRISPLQSSTIRYLHYLSCSCSFNRKISVYRSLPSILKASSTTDQWFYSYRKRESLIYFFVWFACIYSKLIISKKQMEHKKLYKLMRLL